MKKSLAVILASAMAVSLTACGGSGNAKTPEPTTAAEAPKTEAQAEGTEADRKGLRQFPQMRRRPAM